MVTGKDGTHVDMLFGTGVSSAKEYKSLLNVIKVALSSGIRGFDTAPSYGTEEMLARCLRQCMDESCLDRSELFIQTKVDAWQMAEGKHKICLFVTDTMEKMKIEYLDSLLVHWPVPEYMDETWECLSEMQEKGFVRYIGICNLRIRQLERLTEFGSMPQIIQLERNPLRTCGKEIRYCQKHHITVQAYSPLCKMHEDIANSQILRNLAEKYQKNVGQVVMRWHLDTEVVPIFTSTKESRIQEYTNIKDFSLRRDEVEAVASLNKDYKMYLEACACPGF